MNILYITNANNNPESIFSFIKSDTPELKELKIVDHEIDLSDVREFNPDLIIKDRYPFSVPEEIYSNFEVLCFNCAYLPYNKGAHSNIWSFIDETPKGGSIFFVRSSNFEYDLVKRFIVDIPDDATLSSSFDLIYEKIEAEFRKAWQDLLGKAVALEVVNRDEGSQHSPEECSGFIKWLPDGYNTMVKNIPALWDQYNQVG